MGPTNSELAKYNSFRRLHACKFMLVPKSRENGVVSMGQCNTCLQSIGWSLKTQSLSWSLI